MTYLNKNNIYESIHQNLRKKDVYESDMHKIYNLIVGQTNEQLKEKAASDATFQAVKADWDPIGYLIILKSVCFSNQSGHHPVLSLGLATRRLNNTMQYANEKITYYVARFRNAQEANEACNISPITREVQEHGVNILFPLHNTGFDSLQ